MHPPLAATSRDSKQLQSPSLTSPVGRTPPVQAGQRPASRCAAIPTSVCRVSTADGQETGARGAQMPQRRGDSAPAATHRRPGQRHAPCRQSMAGAWLSSHSLRRCVRDSASSGRSLSARRGRSPRRACCRCAPLPARHCRRAHRMWPVQTVIVGRMRARIGAPTVQTSCEADDAPMGAPCAT